MKSSGPLIIDIETAPFKADEHKALFPSTKKKGGLHAIISQVVAIGVSYGGIREVMGYDDFPACQEKCLLEWAGKIFSTNPTPIVGFNIKNFDLPFLKMRAALHGIKMNIPQPRSSNVVDIYEAIGGKWQTDVSACSLSELGWHLYGEAKTSSGADVAKQFAVGDMAAIKEHCLQDVILTEKIYKDFNDVMW